MPTIQDAEAEIVTAEMAELWLNQKIRLSEEIAEVTNQQKALALRLQRLDALLRSAAEIRPEIQDRLDIETEKTMGKEGVALTDAIKRVVIAGKGQAVERNSIRNTLPQHGYPAQKLQANPNYFDTAIRRLLKREDGIQEGPPGHFRLKAN